MILGQRRRPVIPETERVDEPPVGRVDDHGRVFAGGEYRGCVGSFATQHGYHWPARSKMVAGSTAGAAAKSMTLG